MLLLWISKLLHQGGNGEAGMSALSFVVGESLKLHFNISSILLLYVANRNRNDSRILRNFNLFFFDINIFFCVERGIQK